VDKTITNRTKDVLLVEDMVKGWVFSLYGSDIFTLQEACTISDANARIYIIAGFLTFKIVHE